MCASKLLTLLLAAVMAGLPVVAAAQQPADANKAQLRRLQQVQRQLQQEKQQLSTDKARIELELESSRSQAADDARRAAGLGREVASLRSRESELSARVARLEADLAAAQEQLRSSGAENRQLQAQLGERTQQHAACTAQVAGLRETGTEVLTLYENKGCFDALRQREPLTGLGRVAVENAVEDLRDRLANDTSRP